MLRAAVFLGACHGHLEMCVVWGLWSVPSGLHWRHLLQHTHYVTPAPPDFIGDLFEKSPVDFWILGLKT